MHDVMTDDEVDAQLDRYGGHHFSTVRGKNICIDERLALGEALDLHKQVKKELHQASFTGHFIRPFLENQQLVAELREKEEFARAQAMAAFYRVAQCWPKDAKDALGF